MAFLHVPLAFIVLYAFSTEDKSCVFPPPGLTTPWVRRRARTPGRVRRDAPSFEVAAWSAAIAIVQLLADDGRVEDRARAGRRRHRGARAWSTATRAPVRRAAAAQSASSGASHTTGAP
jgi:hypothetical protein